MDIMIFQMAKIYMIGVVYDSTIKDIIIHNEKRAGRLFTICPFFYASTNLNYKEVIKHEILK